MVIGVCAIELHLPGMGSLKQKRRILKPMLARLHNTFNISAAEIEQQDSWQSAIIAFALVTNSTPRAHQVINRVINWVETHYPDVNIIRQEIEIL